MMVTIRNSCYYNLSMGQCASSSKMKNMSLNNLDCKIANSLRSCIKSEVNKVYAALLVKMVSISV